MNPYVFFVGCPRSGTTLVQRLGNAHPELAVAHETRWIAQWYERRIGVSADGFVTPDFVERLPAHGRFKALKLEPDELVRAYRDCEPVRYADFVSTLFDRFAARRGKRLAGDKSPAYVRSLPTLHALWPEAKIVHLIRDGRDVCLSVLEWRQGPASLPTWREDPVMTVALWWEWNVRLGREAGARLGPHLYREIRYEALVADPERECAELCAFLGLEYEPAMLAFHEGRMREGPGLDAKKAWRPVTTGLRRWRDDLAPSDIARFECAVGPLIDELGYVRATPAPAEYETERAARLRGAFADDVRARGRSAPQAWDSLAA